MALRDIIVIDENKCNGCGLCVPSCAEGAIRIIDGKARLIREDYCDGLGACLGHCPQDALRIEKRDVAGFNEEAVKKHMDSTNELFDQSEHWECPGAKALQTHEKSDMEGEGSSELCQWPVELALLSPKAPYFANADLLLAADCVPVACGDFHRRFLRGRVVAIGCPKLDDVRTYVDKLTAIMAHNNLQSVTVVHMEVPCCSHLMWITRQAMALAEADVPIREFVIGINGRITEK